MREDIPVLLLKKLSLLPLQEVRLELNNELSKKIMDLSSSSYNKKVLVILPRNTLEVSPSLKDLPELGVLALIKSCIKLPSGNYRVVIKGLNRVNILKYANYNKNKSILIANIKRLYIKKEESTEEIALKRKLISLTKTYIKLNSESSNSIFPKINENESLDYLTDIIVSFINLSLNKRKNYINEFDEIKRARNLINDLSIELEVIKLNNKLDNDIRKEFEKEQKEYLLKAKINKLNQELGINNSKEKEVIKYREKIKNLDASSSIKEKLYTELGKYEYTSDNSPEGSVIRNYLDTVISLPFNKKSPEDLNIRSIKSKLNKTHHGMDKVKSRIIEYASLKKLNPELNSPVICLIGPPGVGKTTIAMSISKSLKREFIKINVGGLNDSSELTGHRRTYIGASPGKIVNGIKKCKYNNPVILIDEVDKMVKDYKGDPASVLLDILDVNQNKNFVDNYIEEPIDLSPVFFILTANDEENIPPALKDRLEIIYLDSYSIYDKKDIAINYLIPNIYEKYNSRKVTIKEEIVLDIISDYTLESGVRELERVMDKLIRNIIINKITTSKITKKYVKEVLGRKINEKTTSLLKEGRSNILGVSPLGGLIVTLECALVPGEGETIITGNILDQTKDDILVVISYLKSKKLLNLTNEHLHINFNQDIKLDGKSGSLGIAASIVSLIKEKKIKNDIAFSGKLDLNGNVLKVSSIKEKIITAYNNNIKTIYLPKENKDDLEDVPLFIRDDLKIIFINNFDEVINKLFKTKTSKK